MLEDLVRDLRLDTLLEVNLRVEGERCWPISSQQVAHFVQITREALSNVMQHAQAQQVTVDLCYTSGDVRLTVADDGCGMALGKLKDGQNSGYGIANMRERTRQLEGTLDLQSKPGHGTRLSVTMPCNHRNPR